jgi:hypothetical protein
MCVCVCVCVSSWPAWGLLRYKANRDFWRPLVLESCAEKTRTHSRTATQSAPYAEQRHSFFVAQCFIAPQFLCRPMLHSATVSLSPNA